MIGYTTYGRFQKEMNSFFKETGNRLQFTEMTTRMAERGMLQDKPIVVHIPDNTMDMTDEEFDAVVDTFPLSLSAHIDGVVTKNVEEDAMIPSLSDVFSIRHPRFTRPYSHEHNYFEVNYVIKGRGKFVFEKEEHIMQEDEVCIVAPGSMHDFLIEDESSIVITLCIRKSTFDTTFSSLMSRQDLLSYFFRQILRDDDKANYLMFFSGANKEIHRCLRRLMVESVKSDSYSNSCCISYVNLFFAELLRSYSKTVEFYNYEMGSDFSLVLQYIQHNYQKLTLSSLAEFFHYSEPHLCTLIKQNTGANFTDLIKRLRMKDALNYLLNTDVKISEIAEIVGYNSADHFSRVFRSEYKISPQDYRREHKKENQFIPFAVSNDPDKRFN